MTLEEAIAKVVDERKRIDDLWGDQTGVTVGKWLAILTEEVGEVATAILDLQDANAHGSARQRWQRRQQFVSELSQVAAVCVQMMEVLG